MDLTIDNKVEKKTKNNDEINLFMKELSSSLNKKQELSINNNLYNEILKDVELAPKYKDKLQSVINKCLINMSYERDFFYFDYDKRRKDYCLKYYWNGGSTVCDKLTRDDIERFKKNGFTFYEPVDDEDTIGASDSLKDWMKCEVDIELIKLDNKHSKGN